MPRKDLRLSTKARDTVWHAFSRHSVYSMVNNELGKLGQAMVIVIYRASNTLRSWRCHDVHVIQPDSKFRIGWDISGMALMVCDAFLRLDLEGEWL